MTGPIRLLSDRVDEAAVIRACAGEQVRLRPYDRTEAVRRLTAQGLGSREIAQRLGCSPRAVVRARKVLREQNPSSMPT